MRKKLFLETLADTTSVLMKLNIAKLPFREKIRRLESFYVKTIHTMWGQTATPELQGALYEYLTTYEFLHNYNTGSGAIYKMAEKFSHDLNRANLDIPISLLPDTPGMSYCFEFPPNVIKTRNGSQATCALLTIGDRHPSRNGYLWGLRPKELGDLESDGIAFCLLVPEMDPDGTWRMINDFWIVPALEGQTIGDGIDAIKDITHGDTPSSLGKEAVSFLFKCLLYVESAEPDLRPEPSLPRGSKKYLKRVKSGEDLFPCDVVKVGYGFHGKHYSKDTTVVRSFPRWQRCGEGLSQVKLVWVREHERKYKKALNTLEEYGVEIMTDTTQEKQR